MAGDALRLRQSSVPDKVPSPGNLQLGELAINTHDGRLFFKRLASSVATIIEAATFGTTLEHYGIGNAARQTGLNASTSLAVGTSAQRDLLPGPGYVRFNTDSNEFEGYNGTTWTALGGGGAQLEDYTFESPTHFTAGVSTSLTLPRGYGSETQITVFFDGVMQGPENYSLSNDQLNFTTAIVPGVKKIYVKAITRLLFGDLAPESVTADSIRLTEIPAILLRLDAEQLAHKGAPNGYAPLDASVKIPSIYLPSFVDEVLEFANLSAFPSTGQTNRIYTALDTSRNYRWGGTTYVEIVGSPGSTDTVAEGSVNRYFTNSRARQAAVQDSIGAGIIDIAPSQRAVYEALGILATRHSPVFTGNPTAPTPAFGTNSTSLATAEFVQTTLRTVWTDVGSSEVLPEVGGSFQATGTSVRLPPNPLFGGEFSIHALTSNITVFQNGGTITRAGLPLGDDFILTAGSTLVLAARSDNRFEIIQHYLNTP